MSSAPTHAQSVQPAAQRGQSSRVVGAVKLMFACVLVFATCGPSVDAQEDTPAAFFRADRERMQAQRRAPPLQPLRRVASMTPPVRYALLRDGH